MAQVLPLNLLSAHARGDYHLTILEDVGLYRRLVQQLRDVARESQLTWPHFKEEPLAFTRRFTAAYAAIFWNFISQRNVALGTSFSFAIVFIFVAGVIGLERLRLSFNHNEARDEEAYELVGMVPANNSIPEREKPEEGAPGMSKGKGGGSLPEPQRPRGGGGGGNNEQKPASHGKLPPGEFLPQIVAPNPHPPTVKNPDLAVVPHLNADPVLFPPDYRPVPFGDPKSQAAELSSGSGKNGGIGTGENGGIGSGRDGGYGPGEKGNTGGGSNRPGGGGPGGEGGTGFDNNYTRVHTVKEVSRRAVIITKPEPGFTEEARKNGVMGTVKLRLALRADGTVSDVSVIKGLPDGLTERAIQAAKRIQFIPAQRDGRNVSQWVSVEYNFNIY